jgi:hypothetical protein
VEENIIRIVFDEAVAAAAPPPSATSTSAPQQRQPPPQQPAPQQAPPPVPQEALAPRPPLTAPAPAPIEAAPVQAGRVTLPPPPVLPESLVPQQRLRDEARERGISPDVLREQQERERFEHRQEQEQEQAFQRFEQRRAERQRPEALVPPTPAPVPLTPAALPPPILPPAPPTVPSLPPSGSPGGGFVPPVEPHRESQLAGPPGPAPVPIDMRVVSALEVANRNLEAFFGKLPSGGIEAVGKEQLAAAGPGQARMERGQQELLDRDLGPQRPQRPAERDPDDLRAERVRLALEVVRLDRDEADKHRQQQAEVERLLGDEVRQREQLQQSLVRRVAAEQEAAQRTAQAAFREAEAERRSQALQLSIMGGAIGGVVGAGLGLMGAIRSIPTRPMPREEEPAEARRPLTPEPPQALPAAEPPSVVPAAAAPARLPPPEPAAALPAAVAAPQRPPAPEFFQPQHLELNPDAAKRKVQEDALAAGKTPQEADAAGRKVADYVLEHSDRPQNVYKRELMKHTDAGVPDDQAMKMAKEAGDQAAVQRQRVQVTPPSPSPPIPTTEPARPPMTAPAEGGGPVTAPPPSAKVVSYKPGMVPGGSVAAEGAEAGAMGAEAGAAGGAAGMGAAAAAGPIGLVVAAAVQLKEEVDKKLVGAVRTAGETLMHIGNLDGRGLAEQANKGLEAFGTTGKIAAEVNRALMGFSDAVSATAKQLAPYSGQIAASQAMANVAQVQGDIGRANLLAPELSSFVDAQSRLSQASQDVLAQALKPMVPMMTAIVDYFASLMEKLDKNMVLVIRTVEAGINGMIDALNAILVVSHLTSTRISHIHMDMPKPKKDMNLADFQGMLKQMDSVFQDAGVPQPVPAPAFHFGGI